MQMSTILNNILVMKKLFGGNRKEDLKTGTYNISPEYGNHSNLVKKILCSHVGYNTIYNPLGIYSFDNL